jgi:hypothetical protein
MKSQRPVQMQTPDQEPVRAEQEKKPTQEGVSAGAKWTAVQRVRMPHKMGLPLGSGGGGDNIER